MQHSLARIFLCFLLTLCIANVPAQSVHDLEKKRKRIQKEINLTSKLIKETSQNKKAALDQYTTLQQQIKKREELINTLQAEIKATDAIIIRSNEVIESLQSDIETFETEYAQLARKAFRQKMSNSTLLFLFSAKSLNEGFKRWFYLRQYDDYREKQAQLILDTQKVLEKKVDSLKKKKKKKEVLIAEQSAQKSTLSSERDTRNQLYKTLKKDEKRLQTDLNDYIQQRTAMNKAIEEMIITANTPAPVSAPVPSPNPTTTTAAPPRPTIVIGEAELATWTINFQKEKGQLPWPVKSGVITKRFGEQAHPTLRNIKINNNGIDIRTSKNEEARAIFEGLVSGTQFIPGYQHTVIIKHGEYFSVYSNLEKVLVQKGDRVSQKQLIGSVSTNRQTATSEIHFEIWRNKKRLNPIDWVRD